MFVIILTPDQKLTKMVTDKMVLKLDKMVLSCLLFMATLMRKHIFLEIAL